MTFIEQCMLYFSFIAIVLLLVSHGWVNIRDYLKSKGAEKLATKEAEVQARIAAAIAAEKAKTTV